MKENIPTAPGNEHYDAEDSAEGAHSRHSEIDEIVRHSASEEMGVLQKTKSQNVCQMEQWLFGSRNS